MITRRWRAAALSSVFLAACATSAGCTSSHAKTTPCQPGVPGSCVSGTSSVNGANATATTVPPGAPFAGSLQAWGTAHLAGLQALSSEAAHLLAGAGDANQVQAACSKLGSDAKAATSWPAPPDATTAARLKSGLKGLEQLASDCTTAFKTGNRAAASRLVYEANQASAAINQVIQAVNP